MKRTLINIAILSTILGTGMAQAGGWDRSGQDTSIILKEGSLLEVSAVSVAPKVTGAYVGSLAATGDVTPDYSFTNMAFRTEINDNFSVAVIQDEPFGASVDWSVTSGNAYSSVEASIKTNATTFLLGYDIDNITVYGGLKNQSFGASADVPIGSPHPSPGMYKIRSTDDQSIGYVLGAAVERPEIALRVALTYQSKVSHQVAVVETFGGASTSSVLKADTPSSFNLNFQTGIAANTLLFGSVRSVQWTQTDVKPNVFATNAQRSLKKFTSDVVTYNLGVARKVTDQWLGFVTYGTEASEGGTAGPLGPTDGFSKMGLGVTYSGEQADITVAMQKVNNGDTSMDGATMSGNTTLVTAVKVAYKF